MFHSTGIASAIFLALYVLMLIYVVGLFATRRESIKSRWAILLVFVILRIASQVCGIGVGVHPLSTNWIVAYYVIVAQGYVSMVFCCTRYIMYFEEKTGCPRLIRKPESDFLQGFPPIFRLLHPRKIMSLTLIAGNVVFTVFSAMEIGETSASAIKGYNDKRLAGAVLLLVPAFCLFVVAVYTSQTAPIILSTQRTHSHILIFVTFMLMVRAVYNILTSKVLAISSADLRNYNYGGLKTGPLAAEYCIAMLPEFLCACGICLLHFQPIVPREPRHAEVHMLPKV